LARELKRMYVTDYVAAWRRYAKAGSVAGFSSLSDASAKLERLATPTSPLLAMLLTASEHTIVDSMFVRVPLQPVDVVMPLKNKETFVGGANQDYMDQLSGLSTALRQVAAVPPGGDDAALLQAASAAAGKVRESANKLSRMFASEPEREIQLTRLLLSPADRVDALIRVQQQEDVKAGSASAANEAVVAFCGEIRDVLDKLPFSRAQTWATPAELTKHFKPGGTIEQFYDQALQGKVLTKTGSGYRQVPGGPIPTQQLIDFMTAANRITNELFPGGATEPRVQFTLRPQLTETISVLTMSFGDTTMQYARGGERTVTTAWRFSDKGVSFSRRGMNTVEENGPWAALRMYWTDSKPSAVAGTKVYDIVSGSSRATLEMTVSGGVSSPAFFNGLICPTKAVR
jgi:type VI secretion system protein ImpL